MTAQPIGVMPQSGALPTNYPDPDPEECGYSKVKIAQS